MYIDAFDFIDLNTKRENEILWDFSNREVTVDVPLDKFICHVKDCQQFLQGRSFSYCSMKDLTSDRKFLCSTIGLNNLFILEGSMHLFNRAILNVHSPIQYYK